jgi:hypothetical protein
MPILSFYYGERDSKLTASVHLSHFLKAELFENMLKVFESRTQSAQALCFSHVKYIRFAHFFAERAGFEPAIPFRGILPFQGSPFDRSGISPNYCV